jgi:hypothetical protein
MNTWTLGPGTLLNEGMSIPAHGGTLWRTALKAINCRVMSDTDILLLKLVVDTARVCILCQ